MQFCVSHKVGTSTRTFSETKVKKSRANRAPLNRNQFRIFANSEDAENVISGEWPATWSLVEYEDCRKYYRPSSANPRSLTVTRASGEGAEGVISGEWPATWSLVEYEDVLNFYRRHTIKHHHTPQTRLTDIMVPKNSMVSCHPEDRVSDLQDKFTKVTGMPVIREDGVLLGVVSRSDLAKGGTFIHDVMSSPPVVARANDTVAAAAHLMLKYKIHRVPVVDSTKKCVGIVTRSDVFTALADDTEDEVLNVDM